MLWKFLSIVIELFFFLKLRTSNSNLRSSETRRRNSVWPGECDSVGRSLGIHQKRAQTLHAAFRRRKENRYHDSDSSIPTLFRFYRGVQSWTGSIFSLNLLSFCLNLLSAKDNFLMDFWMGNFPGWLLSERRKRVEFGRGWIGAVSGWESQGFQHKSARCYQSGYIFSSTWNDC